QGLVRSPRAHEGCTRTARQHPRNIHYRGPKRGKDGAHTPSFATANKAVVHASASCTSPIEQLLDPLSSAPPPVTVAHSYFLPSTWSPISPSFFAILAAFSPIRTSVTQ